MKEKLFIDKTEDRDVIAMILVRNGYTVRQGKQKSLNGSKYVRFIEYWKE